MTQNGEVQKSKFETNIVLIVNPSSCSGTTGKNWENIHNKLKLTLGEDPIVLFTEKSGDGTTLTREFLRKGFRNVIALGGDGTINEVVNGFFEGISSEERRPSFAVDRSSSDITLKSINPRAILGIFPSGTRNVLAKSLHLPDGGIIESCKSFVNNKRPIMIDVISAVATESSDQLRPTVTQPYVYLNAAEIGIGAEIIDRSKKVREMVKSRIVSTVSSIVATIPAYQSNICEISIDDGAKNILTKVTMCIVANGSYLGGGFKAAPKAEVSDGLLDLVILKNSGSFKILDELVKMKTVDGDSDTVDKVDDYLNDKDILYLHAKKVQLKPQHEKARITVAIDGELIGILPATFQVHHNALTVRL